MAFLADRRLLLGGVVAFPRGGGGGALKRRCIVAVAAAKNGGGAASLYSVLGVSPGASDKEIKRAYRRLALKFHPDVNKEPDAQQKFMQIKQAYQTLIEPSNRAKYEARRQQASRKQAAEPEESLEDLFRDLQAEFGKRMSSTKSLWEELADIGEEFLEFLEKELNVQDDQSDQAEAAKANAQDDVGDTERQPKSETQQDIEDMLEQLKRELGL